jgi:hypothetical protein
MDDLISPINEYLETSGHQIKSDLAGNLVIGGIADEKLEDNSMPFNTTEANEKDKVYKFSIKLLSNLTGGTCSQELSEDNIENYIRTHGQMVYNLDARR